MELLSSPLTIDADYTVPVTSCQSTGHQSFDYDISEMTTVEKVQYVYLLINLYLEQCSKILDCLWIQFSKDSPLTADNCCCCEPITSRIRMSRISKVETKNGELLVTYYDKVKSINLTCVNYISINNDVNYYLWSKSQ